ncbi:MAG: hypothetical protein SOZ52_05795 [Pyramidobacter sp.]|nr:hypothetical protein [Pyramidobacter sp.]
MKRRSKGFLLAETLAAMTAAILFLPPLAAAFSDVLRLSLELKQREESLRIAAACLEMAQARGRIPSSGDIVQNITQFFASYDVSVTFDEDVSGTLCTVSVEWSTGSGRKSSRLVRHMR